MNTTFARVHDTVDLHKVLPPDEAHLTTMLAQLTGSAKFPGPSPCSLERSDFDKFQHQLYWVCEKTDGVRFLLMCVQTDKTLCCLVDRALGVYLAPIQCVPTAMYQGSVIDCELAFNKADGKWDLMMFDAYVLSGVPVHGLPFSRRIQCLKRAMALYTPSPTDPFRLMIKDFVSSTAFVDAEAGLMLERKRAAYAVDGLIMTPENTPPTPGRCPSLLKLKTKHSVDFVVSANGAELSVFDPSTRTHIVVAHLGTRATPGSIVECVQHQGTWQVVCVRQDKKTANDMFTYRKTMANAMENITEDELFSLFRRMAG